MNAKILLSLILITNIGLWSSSFDILEPDAVSALEAAKATIAEIRATVFTPTLDENEQKQWNTFVENELKHAEETMSNGGAHATQQMQPEQPLQNNTKYWQELLSCAKYWQELLLEKRK